MSGLSSGDSSKTERELFMQILGVPLCIETDDSLVLEAVENKYREHLPSERPADPITVRIRRREDGRRTVELEGRQAVLTLGERWPQVGTLVKLLIGRERPDLFLVHGSCVCHNGNAAVFIGASTSGKTTLALALQQRGCFMLADDITPLAPQTACALPLRTSPSMREHTKNLAERFNWDCIHSSGPVVGADRPVPLKAAFFITHPKENSTRVVSIAESLEEWDQMRRLCYGKELAVSSRRSAQMWLRDKTAFDRPPFVEPCKATFALRTFTKHLLGGPQTLRERLVSATKLLGRVETYELRCGDLDETARIVLEHMSG